METEPQPARDTGGSLSIWLLTIATLLLALSLCVEPKPATDLYWQIRTGQIIVQTHQAPHHDVYSWTRTGTPWVAHEWLTFVILWLAHHIAGFGGIWLFLAILAGATWMFYYHLVLRETGEADVLNNPQDGNTTARRRSPLLAFMLTTITLYAVGPFLQPRPQLFTYLFTAITVSVVLAVRRTTLSGAEPGLNRASSEGKSASKRLNTNPFAQQAPENDSKLSSGLSMRAKLRQAGVEWTPAEFLTTIAGVTIGLVAIAFFEPRFSLILVVIAITGIAMLVALFHKHAMRQADIRLTPEALVFTIAASTLISGAIGLVYTHMLGVTLIMTGVGFATPIGVLNYQIALRRASLRSTPAEFLGMIAAGVVAIVMTDITCEHLWRETISAARVHASQYAFDSIYYTHLLVMALIAAAAAFAVPVGVLKYRLARAQGLSGTDPSATDTDAVRDRGVVEGHSVTATRAENRRRLLLLLPMFVLWANLHAGVLIGIGIMAAFAIVDYTVIRLDGKGDGVLLQRRLDLCRDMAVTTIAAFGCTLITPYSYHVYQNFAATVSNTMIYNGVAEWTAPNFNDLYGHVVEVYIAVAVYGLCFSRLRRDPAEMVVFLLLIHEGISANRNVPLMALAGTLITARHTTSAVIFHLGQGKELAKDSLIGPDLPATIAFVILAAIGFSSATQVANIVKVDGPPTGSALTRIGMTAVQYGTNPTNACDFIEREQFPTTMRMYNHYDTGGFLIWKMPDRKVFIDSRADIYFGTMLNQFNIFNKAPYGWRTMVDEYNVDFVVTPSNEHTAHAFLAAPDWALVYADRPDLDTPHDDFDKQSSTLIFIRRRPEFAQLIKRCRRDCPILAQMGRYENYTSLQ